MYDLKPEPEGIITIVTMPFTGIKCLTPKLESFLEKYPKVNIQLVLKQPPISPGEGDIVIAFPLIGPKGPYNSWELSSTSYSLYASVDYLEKYGIPESPQQLSNHRLITFNSGYPVLSLRFNWILTSGIEESATPYQPSFEVNSALGVFEAIQKGIGIGELPDFHFVTQHPDLVKILPELTSPPMRIDFIFEKQRDASPVINELYKHLQSSPA